jgi:hypothetical protein
MLIGQLAQSLKFEVMSDHKINYSFLLLSGLFSSNANQQQVMGSQVCCGSTQISLGFEVCPLTTLIS